MIDYSLNQKLIMVTWVKKVHFRANNLLSENYAKIDLWIRYNIILQKMICFVAFKMFPNILAGIKRIKN